MHTAEALVPSSTRYLLIVSDSHPITTLDYEPTPLNQVEETDVQQYPTEQAADFDSGQPKDVLSGQSLSELRKGFFGRSHESAKQLTWALKQDWQESGSKLKVASSLGRYIAVKAFGRYQLAAMYVSYPSMVVYGNTHSALCTAATAAATGTSWAMASTSAMNSAVNNFPRTFKTAGQLSISRNMNDSLPGLRSCLADRPKSSLKERAFTNLALGVTASVKLLPYIAAAGREQQTQDERQRLRRKLYIGAGLAKATTFGIAAEAITIISHDNPHLANSVEGAIKNPLSWTALGGALMVREFAKNKLTKRRANRKKAQNIGTESILDTVPSG